MINLHEILTWCQGQHVAIFWTIYGITFIGGYLIIRKDNLTQNPGNKYTWSHIGGNIIGGVFGPCIVIIWTVSTTIDNIEKFKLKAPRWL